MTRYLARRALGIIPVLIGVSILVFLILHMVPGDPATVVAGPGAAGEDIERLRQEMGLDLPVWTQYGKWISGIFTGDWGRSIVSRESVLPLLITRFRGTLLLATTGMIGAVLISVPLGITAALHRNKGLDLLLTVIALLGISAPIFWIGLVLQLAFSVTLGWLPATGSGTALHLILPTIAIGANSAGVIMRMTRSSILEVIRQDYIRTARAKGASGLRVVYTHALRNAMVPVVTVIGLQAAYLMGGAVLTETVFVWPGIGKLMVDSIFRRDFPMVQGAILVTGTAFVFVNMVTDSVIAFLDPRIRYD